MELQSEVLHRMMPLIRWHWIMNERCFRMRAKLQFSFEKLKKKKQTTFTQMFQILSRERNEHRKQIEETWRENTNSSEDRLSHSSLPLLWTSIFYEFIKRSHTCFLLRTFWSRKEIQRLLNMSCVENSIRCNTRLFVLKKSPWREMQLKRISSNYADGNEWQCLYF